MSKASVDAVFAGLLAAAPAAIDSVMAALPKGFPSAIAEQIVEGFKQRLKLLGG